MITIPLSITPRLNISSSGTAMAVRFETRPEDQQHSPMWCRDCPQSLHADVRIVYVPLAHNRYFSRLSFSIILKLLLDASRPTKSDSLVIQN